jgi:hypothetical protein
MTWVTTAWSGTSCVCFWQFFFFLKLGQIIMAIENLKKHLIFALSKKFIYRFGYTPNTLDFCT